MIKSRSNTEYSINVINKIFDCEFHMNNLMIVIINQPYDCHCLIRNNGFC